MEKIYIYKLESNLLNTSDTHTILEIVITQEDKIYCSLCLDFNIASEGETEEDALKNIIEAIKDYVELSIENKLELYRPVPIEDNPLLVDKTSVISKIKIAINFDLEYLENQFYV